MAGIKQAIKNGVDQAFTLLEEFVEDVSIEGLGGRAVYDASTGTVTQEPSRVSVEGIFTEYKQVDGEIIRMGDRSLLIRTNEIDAIPPKAQVVRGSEVWNVVSSEVDPSRTVIICHVRRGT